MGSHCSLASKHCRPASKGTFFSPSLQRDILQREGEEVDVQQKPDGPSKKTGAQFQSMLDSGKGGGERIPGDIQRNMENRMGADFSDVRIHRGAQATELSTSVQAKAFTYGNDIYFNSGRYAPERVEGKKLLAHELAHVIQQNGSRQPAINRTGDGSSSCSASVDQTAPPKPLLFIALADMFAGSLLSFAIMMLKFDMMTAIPSGDAFDAYRSRFGDPVDVKGKFKNRFDGSVHASLLAAQISEIKSLIERLAAAEKVLDKGINYQCMGTSARKLGGCSFSKCKSNVDMKACGGLKAIMICPNFWNGNTAEQGVAIVHELFHIKFKFGDHDKAPFAQTAKERLSEPQCYAGLVADINKVADLDQSCPPV